jgi:hypothetical protein
MAVPKRQAGAKAIASRLAKALPSVAKASSSICVSEGSARIETDPFHLGFHFI